MGFGTNCKPCMAWHGTVRGTVLNSYGTFLKSIFDPFMRVHHEKYQLREVYHEKFHPHELNEVRHELRRYVMKNFTLVTRGTS